MRRLKFFIFVLLIILLIIIFFFSIFGTSLSFLSPKEIRETRKLKNDLIDSIKINNIDTVYDKINNMYYYTVSENYENQTYVLKLDLDKKYKYKLVDENLNVIKINYNKPIKVIIYDDKYYYETKIQLTNLPLINIKCKEEITENSSNTIFTYINSNDGKLKEFNTGIKTRGNSSIYFDKKSYRINFYNTNYTKEKKVYLSNFYYGDSLILDAVYRDPSKIRNLLAIDIWNQISDDFTNIDIYSEFVEVFINNEYYGLYVLTEPINRGKLNLDKSTNKDTSIVLKSQSWNTAKSNMNFSNIKDDFFLEYELKYPNDEKLYSKSWEKILKKISNYYDNVFSSTYFDIESTWNMNNYIDIVLFNAFINNSDNNLYKNNYFYMKSLESREVYIQPWDMEYSFGMYFNPDNDNLTEKNINDYNKIYTNFIHENAPQINKLLINRYWELRKNILTEEYFDNLLDNYKKSLSKGAALRDSRTWYEYDIEQEIEDIRIWFNNRLEYFDEYIRNLENE